MMAQATDFEGSNFTFTKPPERDDVTDLKVFQNGHCVVSCWRLEGPELDDVIKSGRVFLSVMSWPQFFPAYVGSETSVRDVVMAYGKPFARTPQTGFIDLSAPQVDKALTDLDALAAGIPPPAGRRDLATRAATVIRLMRAEHQRLAMAVHEAAKKGAQAGLGVAAGWHDRRARETPDAFESEFHEVSARTIRAADSVPNTAQLQRDISRAVHDPGAVVGKKPREQSLWAWITDAVMRVLGERGIFDAPTDTDRMG